jgi:hypothetical protein
MNNEKQSYSKPELIVHGDVEQITQQPVPRTPTCSRVSPTPLSRSDQSKRPSSVTTNEAGERVAYGLPALFACCPLFLRQVSCNGQFIV